MNEQNNTTIKSDFQTFSKRISSEQLSCLLTGALIHASQAKLLSHRARRQSIGLLKPASPDRITETLQHACLALEKLDHAENVHTGTSEHIEPQFHPGSSPATGADGTLFPRNESRVCRDPHEGSR
jgi:hypothetical protein